MDTLFIGLILILVVGYVGYRVYQHHDVRKNSARYVELMRINQWYEEHMEECPKEIRRHYTFDTKAKYDNAKNQERVYNAFLLKNRQLLMGLLSNVESNQKLASEYQEDIKESLSALPPYPKYQRVETMLLGKLYDQMQFPKPFVLDYRFSYTSPKGRNHYESMLKQSAAELKDYLEELEANKVVRSEYEIFRDMERAKMTAGLRYDILKRDGFMCQICGADANTHGVTLHVDHIKPVARWGKTEAKNLQTLCRDCNLGKGAKG